ncbi:LysR family transcriptional regulator, partial [Escherichia coli]
MDSNNQIEPCLSRKSSEGKPQIFTTLRNIDLNLLTIFEAVYVHKGIVNAAKVLNLTPSAISQSIQKLRVIFPDPLFIRKGQGVTPTAFAGNDSNLLIVFYVQIMPDDFVMQLHR